MNNVVKNSKMSPKKSVTAKQQAKSNLTKRKNPDWDNLDRGYRYLTQDMKLPHDQAVAVMGNVIEESQGDYKAAQKNGGGRGLIQWDGRKVPSGRYGQWGSIWASVAKPANVYDATTDTVKNYWAPWGGLKGDKVRQKFIKAPLKEKARIYAESYLRPGKLRIADRQLSTMQLDSIYNPRIKDVIVQKDGGMLEFLKNGGQVRKMQTASGGPIYEKDWSDKIEPYAAGIGLAGDAIGLGASTTGIGLPVGAAIAGFANAPNLVIDGYQTARDTWRSFNDGGNSLGSAVRNGGEFLLDALGLKALQYINKAAKAGIASEKYLTSTEKALDSKPWKRVGTGHGRVRARQSANHKREYNSRRNKALEESNSELAKRGVRPAQGLYYQQKLTDEMAKRGYGVAVNDAIKSANRTLRQNLGIINGISGGTNLYHIFKKEKGGMLQSLKKGSGIHIKEKNKGKFTDYCGGKVTSACIAKGKSSSNPAIRKRATFAANARKWKHQEGGLLELLPIYGTYKDFEKFKENPNWRTGASLGLSALGDVAMFTGAGAIVKGISAANKAKKAYRVANSAANLARQKVWNAGSKLNRETQAVNSLTLMNAPTKTIMQRQAQKNLAKQNYTAALNEDKKAFNTLLEAGKNPNINFKGSNYVPFMVTNPSFHAASTAIKKNGILGKKANGGILRFLQEGGKNNLFSKGWFKNIGNKIGNFVNSEGGQQLLQYGLNSLLGGNSSPESNQAEMSLASLNMQEQEDLDSLNYNQFTLPQDPNNPNANAGIPAEIFPEKIRALQASNIKQKYDAKRNLINSQIKAYKDQNTINTISQLGNIGLSLL